MAATDLYTLEHLERLVFPGVPEGPHVVDPIVHDLWLSIAGATLHPSPGNRERLHAAAGRASAESERRLPGKGTVDRLHPAVRRAGRRAVHHRASRLGCW
jgi:hypothetical protein